MQQILLVEDDHALSNGIVMALQTEQIQVTQCRTLAAARDFLENKSPELMILDINLPDGSGLKLLQERSRENPLPVILLTANDTEMDIVAGLEMGADDYITKPFSLAVLRARVHTQMRKENRMSAALFCQDSFRFDFEKMQFFKGTMAVELSKTEQKLLRLLVENKGITLARGMLIDRIWTDGAEYVDENALSVAMKRLRDKLEDCPARPQYMKTVYGIGYSWVAKPDENLEKGKFE